MRQFFVYILTNKNNTVLYTGVTNDLERRLNEHREKSSPSLRSIPSPSLRAGSEAISSSFTTKYNIKKLVWYEIFASPAEAIAAEKKIKAGSRIKKIKLIEEKNPNWNDLAEDS